MHMSREPLRKLSPGGFIQGTYPIYVCGIVAPSAINVLKVMLAMGTFIFKDAVRALPSQKLSFCWEHVTLGESV